MVPYAPSHTKVVPTRYLQGTIRLKSKSPTT